MAIGARKQPLYDQLVDILTEKIDHEYRAGDMIPSERELSERYGLSRTTVRLALQELERLGLVVRQHGRGTFVTDRSAKATNLMQSYSFTEQMRAMGREPETTILEFCEMEADKNLAEHMGLRIGDRIFKLKRLRSADNMPMMVERSYLPVRQFLSLKRPLLERKPLYDVIEQDFQQKIRVAEEEFYASIAPPTPTFWELSRARLCSIWSGLRITSQTRLWSTHSRLLVPISLNTRFTTSVAISVRIVSI